MKPRGKTGSAFALDARNTARVTLSNPRNGQQSCVDVCAHPADIADAVVLFARNQCICPTEVEISTDWPKTSNFRVLH